MTLRYLKIGALAAAALAGAVGGSRRVAQDGLYIPTFVYRTGALRAERHPHRRRLQGLLHAAQRARRRHRGREDHPRGVRDQLRHQGRRRVLRAAEEQEPAHDQPLLDRHHLRAHPQGAGRQDPDPVDGLRAHGRGGRLGPRRGCSTSPTSYWSQASAQDQVHRRQGRRPRQAQGQEDHAHLSQQPLRQRADPDAGGALQEVRLRVRAPRRRPSRARSRRRRGSRSVRPSPTGSSSGAGA